ncbi:nitroreductase family protein [Lactobacillus sp. ESL0731]|uniref:nitroreductase family protein n=1 Tax=unclassified Lactobacillus TaxID=2620435 RepID=UPI0023F68F25|nr:MULTISPECIES: nitroreductase family protein [unclassified Lactobacillus]WEV50373.1 nitroreductase family protein [Lactobacillus sp. ESL0700]WEV61503.1 nitroreductase family protein [Lactobacillus sp. ESL0731]
MSDPILKRVAIRKYTDEKVSQDEIEQLLQAFQAAPCGMHETDVMQVTVVEDEQLLAKIEQLTDNACYGAPLLFVINVKKDSHFGERDASVAAENIMVEAANLDLGSVYLMMAASTLNTAPDLQAELGITSEFSTAVIVAVGHAAETPSEDRTNRYRVIRK